MKCKRNFKEPVLSETGGRKKLSCIRTGAREKASTATGQKKNISRKAKGGGEKVGGKGPSPISSGRITGRLEEGGNNVEKIRTTNRGKSGRDEVSANMQRGGNKRGRAVEVGEKNLVKEGKKGQRRP